ncbi:MAG: response regulator [candidate division NC10 bacterium]|nr:response regulator [candidate division NC10 bacterium]
MAKILLIDDDVDFVEINTTILKKKGYEVISAYNGKQGFEKAKAEKPDLIVLDVMMMDRTEGFYTARQLRSEATTKSIPLILLTAIHQEEKAFRFAPDETWLPVDVFLDKPVKPERLLEEIQRQLPKKA